MGNKNGHIDNAAICGSLLSSYSLFSGEKLETVEGRMNSFANWAKEERLYGSSRLGFLPFLQLVKCLQQGGQGERGSVLAGKEMDAREMAAAAEKSPMVSCSLSLCKVELACILGDYTLAGEVLSTSPDILKVRPGHFSGCRFTFYEFITSAELARGKTKSSAWSKRAEAAHKLIIEWVKSGNTNCCHLVPLVKAEVALMKGKRTSAAKHFADAVNMAESGTFLQDRAISMERAANFYWMEGDTVKAASCYSKSRDLYEEWGAAAKVRALDKCDK